ncbi:MAG TPA: MarR family transcriptional regulator [Propionibacteriaceae bacterium]|jgi:DNA-binding MarR family transcriptional regulator
MALPPLNAAEEEVWRALVRLMVVLPRALDDDLQQAGGLSLTHYVVLMRLSEVADQQLRMSDLASQVALSPSRMSRIVQLLQGRGLVTRTVSAEDARAGIVTLTEAGLKALRAAWPAHLASARTIVFDNLEPDQLALIAPAVARLLEAAQQPAATRSPGPHIP